MHFQWKQYQYYVASIMELYLQHISLTFFPIQGPSNDWWHKRFRSSFKPEIFLCYYHNKCWQFKILAMKIRIPSKLKNLFQLLQFQFCYEQKLHVKTVNILPWEICEYFPSMIDTLLEMPSEISQIWKYDKNRDLQNQ